MTKVTPLALIVFGTTLALVAIGTIFPVSSAVAFAGGSKQSLGGPNTAEGAAQNLGVQMKLAAWPAAYESLANKAQFTEPEFYHDLTGYALSLRTYATLDSFDVQPLHESATEAELLMKLRWSSVVGTFDDTRDLHVVKNGDRWAVDWPLVHQQHVPPQVIPVNYLRWDVIRSGEGDDWGTQDVEAPHVRIVDMHPVNRADGLVVMGELLNEDIVPAFVSVRATLLGKDGSTVASAGTFDMINHTLLPKQVTPFIIHYPGVDISQVGSIRMEPLSVLVGASADPVVEILNQKFTAGPGASVTGQLSNQSGLTVNVAHVLTTLYDQNGQVVWVAGQYIDRALLPQTPVDFRIAVPEDLAKKVSTQRTVVADLLDRGPVLMVRGAFLIASGVAMVMPAAVAQNAMSFPAKVVAAEALSVPTTGSGKAVLYVVGPGQALREEVQLGMAASIPAGVLYNAGHYLAILAGASATETAEFDVVPAPKPEILGFLAKPSRLPVGMHHGISGAVYVFDAYHNVITTPLAATLDLSLPSGVSQTRTVTTRNGLAWAEMDSAAKEGAARFTARVGSASSTRVIQQVPGDPCSISISAKPDGGRLEVRTAQVRDCGGNAIPDGTIVTFTQALGGQRTTVDVPLKQGVAVVSMPAQRGATISAASGVVAGNEIRWEGGK